MECAFGIHYAVGKLYETAVYLTSDQGIHQLLGTPPGATDLSGEEPAYVWTGISCRKTGSSQTGGILSFEKEG